VLVAQLAAARAFRQGSDADDVPDPVNESEPFHREVAGRIAAHLRVLVEAFDRTVQLHAEAEHGGR
jgi:hypothetical protein